MLNKRIVQGIIAFVIVAVLIFMYRKYKNKSEYVIPPTPTSDTNTNRQTRYSSNLVSCETTYINDVNSGTAAATAMATLDACISSNVTSYYNDRCPFLPNADGTTAVLTANNGLVGGSTNVSYVEYRTDIDAINTVYTPLISAAGNVYSTNIIMAARKADFTGATRKYFATLCPDLYTTSTDTTSQALYRGWTKSASSSSSYGWMGSNVTLPKIWEWAKYAGVAPRTEGNTYMAPTTPLIGAPALGPSFPVGSACSSLFTVTPSGSTVNWQTAADNGPGTVRSGVTFPWSTTAAATCAPSSTYILGATAANPLP
jgi:hypothetical protein